MFGNGRIGADHGQPGPCRAGDDSFYTGSSNLTCDFDGRSYTSRSSAGSL
jgi:hypothetical protein